MLLFLFSMDDMRAWDDVGGCTSPTSHAHVHIDTLTETTANLMRSIKRSSQLAHEITDIRKQIDWIKSNSAGQEEKAQIAVLKIKQETCIQNLLLAVQQTADMTWGLESLTWSVTTQLRGNSFT